MGQLRDHTAAESVNRAADRYDLDWIAVLVFGVLIIGQAAAAFQPWSTYLLLIWNDERLPGVGTLLDLIDISAIPILFTVLGMGLRRAIPRRTWKQLAGDGTRRILIPFSLGTFAIGPLSLAMAAFHYYGRASYVPTPAHLWFLGNVLLYLMPLLPLVIWMKRRPDNWLVRGFRRLLGGACGVGIVLLAVPAIFEVILVTPPAYTSFVFTWHGLMLGFICMILGFLFVCAGETGRRSAERARFGALALGCGLFIARQLAPGDLPNVLIALEPMSWIIAVWGFASRYLDRPSRTLRYLSSAAFPVYIVHLPVQILVSSFLIPLGMHPLPKFLLLVVLTLGGSLGLYEGVRRVRWVRLLFGMEWTQRTDPLGH